MGQRQEAQPAIFYEFSLENHVPQNHRQRSMDRCVDLAGMRAFLTNFHSHTGRPSADPALLIGMLLVGYFLAPGLVESAFSGRLKLCAENISGKPYTDDPTKRRLVS